jgi:hypothetical protein
MTPPYSAHAGIMTPPTQAAVDLINDGQEVTSLEIVGAAQPGGARTDDDLVSKREP